MVFASAIAVPATMILEAEMLFTRLISLFKYPLGFVNYLIFIREPTSKLIIIPICPLSLGLAVFEKASIYISYSD